jgi:hypothetical protein
VGNIFIRSCKEVSSLVITREDRALSIVEQLQLRGHMFICKACPIFERQILTMRHAMQQWRHYSEPPAEPSKPPEDLPAP